MHLSGLSGGAGNERGNWLQLDPSALFTAELLHSSLRALGLCATSSERKMPATRSKVRKALFCFITSNTPVLSS